MKDAQDFAEFEDLGLGIDTLDGFLDDSDFNFAFMETRSAFNDPLFDSSSSTESDESACSDDFQSDDEDLVESLNTILQDDELNVDKLLEVFEMDDEKRLTEDNGLKDSKERQFVKTMKSSVQDLISRYDSSKGSSKNLSKKLQSTSRTSGQVAAILEFLSLRSLNSADLACWTAIADPELVYTSPGLPEKGHYNGPVKKRKVRGLNAVASDVDVYRVFSNSLSSHFGPRGGAVRLSFEVDPDDVLVAGDKGMTQVSLRSRGLQALGYARELEERGMLYCHFQSGTSLLNSLELSVDVARLASQLHSLNLLKQRKVSPLPAGSLAALDSPVPPVAAIGSPRSGDAIAAPGVAVASEHGEVGQRSTRKLLPASVSTKRSAPAPYSCAGDGHPLTKKKRRRRDHQQQQQVLAFPGTATANFMAQSLFAAQCFQQMAAMNAMAHMAAMRNN